MKKYILTSFIVVAYLFSNTTIAQTIEFKIKNFPDTTVHLVKYVGSKLYYADTAEIKNGKVVFDGKKQEPGILALLFPEQKYFEFIYNNEDIKLETKAPDFVKNMVVKASKENKLFYDYIHFIQQSKEESQLLSQQMEKLSTEEEKEAIRNQLKAQSERVKQQQKRLVAENEATLTAKIILMNIDIDVPEPPKNEDGSLKDSLFGYKYFRDHYFDHIDLKDDRLAHTPMTQKKLEYFYSPQMLLQHPDTLIKYLTKVLDQVPPHTTMYRLFALNTVSHFEKSNIMGMDKVSNYLINRYFCSKDDEGLRHASWMDEEKLDELCKNTKTRLKLAIGEVPPNLILTDSTSQKWYNLHQLEHEYIVLYFWDPGCGHCKKETPKLERLYTEKLKARNVEIFAIGKAIGDDFKDWKKFIQKHNLSFLNVGVTQPIYEQAQKDALTLIPRYTTLESLNYQDTYYIYSTPRVWILDKDKRIVAKNLGVAQIEDFLDRLQGFSDAPKLFPVEDKKENEK